MNKIGPLTITTTTGRAVQLAHIGSVIDVLAGKLPTALSGKRFLATSFSYGFELASPRDKQSLGEALIVNGLCYATSSDKTSPDYYHTICGHEFVTGGMFLIPRGIKPSHKALFKSNQSPIPLFDFYTKLYETVKQPVAFVGLMEFATFHGTAIGAPPIFGKAIFDHQKEYFPHPEMKCKNVTVFLMGVLANYEDLKGREITKQLQVVLYKNPFDSGSVLASHAHVLTLKHPVNNIEEIGPDLVESTLHLFPDGTTIRSLQADIFTISGLDNYQDTL